METSTRSIKIFGLALAAFSLGLSAYHVSLDTTFENILLQPLVLFYLGLALLFLTTSLVSVMAIPQTLLALCMIPAQAFIDSNGFVALLFGLFFMAMCLQHAWIGPKTKKRIYLVFGVIGLLIMAPLVILRRLPIPMLASTAISVFVFAVIMLSAFSGCLIPNLFRPKKIINLNLAKLTLREQEMIYLRLVHGKSMKEVALEYRISLSTVRNYFSYAYKKLGVTCAEDLVRLYETCEFQFHESLLNNAAKPELADTKS